MPLEIMAILLPRATTPLVIPALLTALFPVPFALLPRFLYQAKIIHYKKSPGRPELHAVPQNITETGEKIEGGIKWQQNGPRSMLRNVLRSS
jgi:hypothetical protein